MELTETYMDEVPIESSLLNLKESYDAEKNENNALKNMNEVLNMDLELKESIIMHITSENDNLRQDCDDKLRKWEAEKRMLVLALEKANVKVESLGLCSDETKLPSEETLEEKIVKLENENQMLKLNQEISDLLIMDLNLKNEEMSIMLLVLNQGISEFEAMNEDRNELEMYKEKLEEACDALDTANFELECELDAMKLTCERLQNDLEKSQVRRKELEDSLLAQVVFGESLIQERRIEEQHVKEAENDKLRFLHIIEEKDKILELLQKEVEWLEHESFKKEFESAVVVKRYMEGSKSKEHEKEKFIHLMNSRRMKLDEIINQMDSLQKKLSDSLTRFSSKHEDDHPHGHYCYDHSEEGAEALFLLLERLKKENTSLIENANNLALDKERLLNFVLGLGDKMFEFSSSDKELMDLLRSMMECFDQNKDDDDDNDNDDDGILVSENVIMNSPTGFEIEA